MVQYPYFENAYLYMWLIFAGILSIGVLVGLFLKIKNGLILLFGNIISIGVGILITFLSLKYNWFSGYLKSANNLLSSTNIKLVGEDLYALKSIICGVFCIALLFIFNFAFFIVLLVLRLKKSKAKMIINNRNSPLKRVGSISLGILTFSPIAFLGSGLMTSTSKIDSKMSNFINAGSRIISIGNIRSFRNAPDLINSIIDSVEADYSKPIVAYTLGLIEVKNPIKYNCNMTLRYSQKDLEQLTKKLEVKSFLKIYFKIFIKASAKKVTPWAIEIMEKQWKNKIVQKLKVRKDVFEYIYNEYKKLINASNEEVRTHYADFVINKFYEIKK